METSPQPEPTPAVPAGEADVHRVRLHDREILLVGTAHVSQESADLVRRVITEERPDTVCVELDERRYRALSEKKRWDNLDLKRLIRERQLSTLLANLVLAAYQRRLGRTLGVMPGTELLEAARTAEELGIAVRLADRDVRVTLRRAWHATSLPRKIYLLATLLAGIFDRTELSEEELRRLRRSDVLSELLKELGEALPELKAVLIDERDTVLSENIKAAPGGRIVAVVGAGHVEGIRKALHDDRRSRLAEIQEIPPARRGWRHLGWAVPALIVGSLAAIGVRKGAAVAGDNLLYWILANGIPSALGAALALGHPATVAAAFMAAPLTSLTPVIGAGYVTAFVQAVCRPPVVREFENVLDDMGRLTGWWRNRLLRVLLTFLLPGIGSLVGTWIGGIEIVRNLF